MNVLGVERQCGARSDGQGGSGRLRLTCVAAKIRRRNVDHGATLDVYQYECRDEIQHQPTEL